MVIKIINCKSEEYISELQLRNEILRKPLGLSIYFDNLSKEDKDYHVGAFLNEELVGCLVLTPLTDKEIKMRQVAVKESLQGLGIGKKLVAYSELISKENNYNKIMLNARKAVVEFYKKLGYEIIGKEFIEDSTGLLHLKMFKDITG